jgi:lipopolysaccharide biosynthesis glycosyltransferase
MPIANPVIHSERLSETSLPVVFLSFDKNYLIPASVVIFSLLKNHPGQAFIVYLLIDEEEAAGMDSLLDMIQEMGSEGRIKTLHQKEFESLKFNLHFTPATYFRTKAAELFEENKIIYLDSDLLIHGDLMEVWNMDIENYPLAAVHDPMVRDFNRLDLTPQQGYFNTGFMLLNLDYWRKTNLGERVISYLHSNSYRIQYADQCGFNAVLQGDWKRIPPKWNVQTTMLEKDGLTFMKDVFLEEEISQALQQPRVIHFTGPLKPWNMGISHPYKNLFWKYLEESPIKRRLPLNFSLGNLFKSLFPLTLKKWYWRYLNRKSAPLALF